MISYLFNNLLSHSLLEAFTIYVPNFQHIQLPNYKYTSTKTRKKTSNKSTKWETNTILEFVDIFDANPPSFCNFWQVICRTDTHCAQLATPTFIFTTRRDFDGPQQISGFNFLSINFNVTLRWIRQVALRSNGSMWWGALGTLAYLLYIGRVAYVPLCRSTVPPNVAGFSELYRLLVKLVRKDTLWWCRSFGFVLFVI